MFLHYSNKFSLRLFHILLFGLMLFLVANVVTAHTHVNKYKHEPFLAGGFNVAHADQCAVLIKKCPVTRGVLPDLKCESNILKKNEICSQAQSLADVLNSEISLLTAKQFGNLVLIKQFFPADGQNSYHIITPQGSLIQTTIDPRKLSKSFAKKYEKASFFITNVDAPLYIDYGKKGQAFIVKLKITDGCRTCKVIGYAKVKFHFDHKGKHLKVRSVGGLQPTK